MKLYPEIAMEKAMTRQEVILRAYAKRITWIQAAEILGYSPRHLRRIKQKYEQFGFHALFDGRIGKASPRRVPISVVEEVLRLFQDEYFDFNVSHFHEKLVEVHRIQVSYTWTKCLLQKAGLVKKDAPRKKHLKKRLRRPLPGMLLHIDGSQHQWFGDERWYDLIVILDDATSEIYYARLVEAEATRTVMLAIRWVIEEKGIFCALYSDRASHFFLTPKAGEAVDKQALTQVGRALKELGIQLIPAYSPQARGRSERSFRTWQGRLPQELRISGITDVEEANQFLQKEFTQEFNRRFTARAQEEGTAFVPCWREDLDRIFSIQSERIVNKDNTIKFKNLILQIKRQSWRGSLAGCRVMVYQHFDDTLSIGFGAHSVGSYSHDGQPLKPNVKKAVGLKTKVNSSLLAKQPAGHLMC